MIEVKGDIERARLGIGCRIMNARKVKERIDAVKIDENCSDRESARDGVDLKSRKAKYTTPWMFLVIWSTTCSPQDYHNYGNAI